MGSLTGHHKAPSGLGSQSKPESSLSSRNCKGPVSCETVLRKRPSGKGDPEERPLGLGKEASSRASSCLSGMTDFLKYFSNLRK